MDRYGASTHGFEFADGSDYPHRDGPLDRDDNYDSGYGRGASMREQGPLRGERSGRDHRLGISDDDDSDLGESDRPTGRRLSDRRGATSYASDTSISESEYEPRDRYRRRAGGARGDGSRHHGLSPDTLDSDDSDDNDSDSESPATRDGHRGPVLRRAEPLRSDLRFNGEHSEDDSDSDFGPRRGEHGPARRRAMAAAYAGRRGSAGTSSSDDDSGDGLSAFRRGIRDRMHRLCQQDDSLDDDDDLDDSEDDEMRGARRAAPGYGWSSGRY
ncbi:MAG: hypothetical protein Q9175_001687 [Cornicularia normoerica]